MSRVWDSLKRLFRSSSQRQIATDPPGEDHGTVGDDPDDLSWLDPPSTLADPGPWDKYWYDQLSNDVAGFVHLFTDDGDLIDTMRANGLRRVLCVGNGLSLEPHALAWAGFDVTALDLSPFATEVAGQAECPEELMAQLLGGRPGGSNGHPQFVVGDLLDAACCPGLYDVVIERKTLQLFPEGERPAAIQAVANRLAPRGIFFSHCHDGRCRGSDEPRHALEPWFRAEGWPIDKRDGPLETRIAWLFTTTG